MPDVTPHELTFSDEVSRCIDQLCTQMSINNVTVPKFVAGSDIFDYLAEYEAATSTLTEDQRRSLLVKAFPVGRMKVWFDNELKPMIDTKKPWLDIKAKIVERFSDVEDRDRHLLRLREAKYDSDGNQRLLDFIEDLAYSHRKAYPNVPIDHESCIRFIKAAIPSALKVTLDMMPEFQSAVSIKDLKKAAQRYDKSRTFSSASEKVNKLDTKELMNMFSQLIKGVEKSTKEAVTAAIRSNQELSKDSNHVEWSNQTRDHYHGDHRTSYGSNLRPRTPPVEYRGNERPKTPETEFYPRSPRFNRYRSNHSNGNRERTPDRNYNSSRGNDYHPNYNSRSPRDHSPANHMERYQVAHTSRLKSPQRPTHQSEDSKAFNNEAYYKKFGKPPSPCAQCGYMHWIRHCHESLN